MGWIDKRVVKQGLFHDEDATINWTGLWFMLAWFVAIVLAKVLLNGSVTEWVQIVATIICFAGALYFRDK